MSRYGTGRRLPVIVTILIAVMLTVLPLLERAVPFRPDWVALILIYWAMMLPRTWSIGSAWLVGLVLDVALGTILGQHALALTVIILVTVRFHLLMRVFPVQQLTATVFALLALYQFLLFWTNGVAGTDVEAIYYWAPVVSGTLLWPVVKLLLAGVRVGAQSRR